MTFYHDLTRAMFDRLIAILEGEKKQVSAPQIVSTGEGCNERVVPRPQIEATEDVARSFRLQNTKRMSNRHGRWP